LLARIASENSDANARVTEASEQLWRVRGLKERIRRRGEIVTHDLRLGGQGNWRGRERGGRSRERGSLVIRSQWWGNSSHSVGNREIGMGASVWMPHSVVRS
jgi:hypothetical protein